MMPVVQIRMLMLKVVTEMLASWERYSTLTHFADCKFKLIDYTVTMFLIYAGAIRAESTSGGDWTDLAAVTKAWWT